MPGENDKQIVKQELTKTESPKAEAAKAAPAKVEVAKAEAKAEQAKVAPAAAKKKKLKEVPSRGQAHVSASYNNTIVTITDPKGDVIGWSSAGKCGFKGPKKSTAYAAGVVVKNAVTAAVEMGLREVEVFIKGVGAGREAAVRALNANGIGVLSIKDVTPIPHNGPRPPKVRRV